MDIVINFFRDTLDGGIYYTILVINTIFIFAIIGYLGEKNKRKNMQLGMNANFDLNNVPPVDNKEPTKKAEVVSIPQAQEPRVINPLIQNNVSGDKKTANVPVNNLGLPSGDVNNIQSSPNVINNPVVNQVVPNDNKPVMIPIDTDKEMKAPKVLVIGSDSKE